MKMTTCESMFQVPILLDSGKQHNVIVSKFDRWSAVVLKLHGLTGYPVNLMRLLRPGNQRVDFSDSVGYQTSAAPSVRLDVSAISSDFDLLYGIPLRFKVAKGVTEVLKVAPSRTIKSVKDTLERVGVPNASMYELMVGEYRLPNKQRVVDVIEEYKRPIDLSLRQYPVFIHGPHNVIYKMLAYSKETLAAFLMRVKMKTGLSYEDYNLFRCGKLLEEQEDKPVFETSISVRSSIFLMPRKHSCIFFVLKENWLTKLRLPVYPHASQIKDILWKERTVPEGGLASIGNFLQWYFFSGKVEVNKLPERKALAEKMITYEGMAANKYMQMKVEMPYKKKVRKKKRRPKRAQSMPPDPHGLLKTSHPHRHKSADYEMPVSEQALADYNRRKRAERNAKNQDQNNQWVFSLRHEYNVKE